VVDNPTGNVALIANTGPSGQQGVQAFSLTNGTASGATNVLPGGSYTVVAQYPGDGVFGPSSSSSTSVTVAKEPSKIQFAYELFDPVTGLQTNPNATTAVFGTRSILRVNVTSQAGDACPTNAPGSAGCPTGSLTLTDSYNGGSATPLDAGTYPLNSLGYAEDLFIDLAGGTHALKAIYSGDNSYSSPASPTPDTLTITQAPTTTTISAGPTVAPVGSVVNLGATIVAQNIFSKITPNVTVNFYVGNTLVAAAGGGDVFIDPNTHQASFVTNTNAFSLPHGQLNIVGKSSGDASYAPSTSAPITVSVLYPTNLALSSSNPTVQRGTNVTFTAQVTSTQTGAPPITGSVQFASDGVPLSSMNLANGQAQFTTSSLPAGTHTISAQYAGDSNYFMSNGQTTETVNLFPTTTTVSSSNPAKQQGQSVTPTAHVAPVQMGGPALTSTVQFLSSFSLTGGDTPLGTAPLSNGQAQITTTALPSNTQFVFAGYSGDNNHANSTGSAPQTVTAAADFSIAANPQTTIVSSPGSRGSTTLTFTAMNGFSGTFNLSPAACSGLPAQSNCSFSPSTVTLNSTTTTGMTALTVSTMGPSDVAPHLDRAPAGIARLMVAVGVTFVFLFLLSVSPAARRWNAAFGLLALAALLTFAACGGGGGGSPHNPGTPIGVDPNVVVSVSSGGVAHNIQLSVNVQ
jgi:Big-like domain-containing protein